MTNAARRLRKLPTLAGALYGFVLLSALIASGVIVLVLHERARQFENEVQLEAVSLRGTSLIGTFTKTLEREWLGLEAATQIIDPSDRDRTRELFTAVSRRGQNVLWAGYADKSGIIFAASNGYQEGDRVDDDEWYRRGLGSDFAGEVYEIRPLARFIETEEEEQLKYIDISAPFIDTSGRTTGVVVYRLRISAMRGYLETLANDLRLDVFLFDQNDKEIFSIRTRSDVSLSDESLHMVASGTPGVRLLSGIDGNTYAVSHSPDLPYTVMPSFGWKIVVRVPARTSETGLRDLSMNNMAILGGLALFLAMGTFVFVRHFMDPVRKLAASAKSIAEGKDVYPYEARRTRELADLSSSLARLQARLHGDG